MSLMLFFDKESIDKTIVDKFEVEENLVNRTSNDEFDMDKALVDGTSIDKISVEESNVDETFVNRHMLIELLSTSLTLMRPLLTSHTPYSRVTIVKFWLIYIIKIHPKPLLNCKIIQTYN